MIRLANFEGLWRLDRMIEDERAGFTGQLNGTAVWRADAVGLVQDEDGLLRYGNAAPLKATRRYLWRMEGADIAVYFEDGRPFHVLPAQGCEAVHHCDPDLYRVTYDFRLPDKFTQTWRVAGPRKAMRIISHFTKLEG